MYKKYILSIIEIDYLEKIEGCNEFIYCKFCNSKIDDD